jgi:heptosyltransferase I
MNSAGSAILVIRLGALGDILHALPAVASLKQSFPDRRILWLVSRKWLPILAGNPTIDELIPFERSDLGSFRQLRSKLRRSGIDWAVDFQGLLQSAVIGKLSRARTFYGFDRVVAREPLASLFYTQRIHVVGPHRIERNLQLVQATGATTLTFDSWIPPGADDGKLPRSPFVLASPFAGWKGKEWPLDRYDQLGQCLKKEGIVLVLNVSEQQARQVSHLKHVTLHVSSLDGLIHATRMATAVVGVDSGPLHIAAALKKPGVAMFGPTDPAQTGPFHSPMQILRAPNAKTTYKRGKQVDPSMSDIQLKQVMDALAALSNSRVADRLNETPVVRK